MRSVNLQLSSAWTSTERVEMGAGKSVPAPLNLQKVGRVFSGLPHHSTYLESFLFTS